MKKCFLQIFVLAWLILTGGSVQAGGPIYISTDNVFSHWDNSSTITYHMEGGTCGPYSNAEMQTFIESALDAWADLAETDLTFSIDTGTLPDIDGDNYQSYLVTGLASENDAQNSDDGFIPIVFDDDAEITEALIGTANKFLFVGLASLHNVEDEDFEIFSDGQVIINCRCLAGHPTLDTCDVSGTEIVIDEETIQSTIVHEIGHLLNLDHSIANDDAYTNNDDDDDELLPTMYPFVFTTLDPFSVSQDDVAAIGAIYPSEVMDTDYCLVTGTILNIDDEPLQCVNVIASTDDDADTVTFVSGAVDSSFSFSGGFISFSDECDDQCGDFQFYLETGKEYTISTREIDDAMVGASAVGPCRSAQKSGIEAETGLATVTAAQCTAGATVSLGDISTLSTASGATTETTTEEETTEEEGGGSAGGGDSGVDNPVGYGCTLQTTSHSHSAVFAFELLVLFLFVFRLKKTQ